MEQPLQVLIVDDNDADVHWMQITLTELPLDCRFTILTDGEQALNYFLNRGADLAAPEPDIIFLDINLPRLTGVEVLSALPDARRYPICVVSGSRLEQEMVRERFSLAAQCYIVKPVDRHTILQALNCFDHLKPIVDQIRNS